MKTRWKQRPEGSNWGEFGPDDQLGSMNMVGRDQVLKGLAEVRDGRIFSLSLPLDYPGGTALHPSRHPPRRFATLRAGKSAGEQCFCFALARDNPLCTDVFSDDVVLLHTQYSTQWDGLAHVGSLFDADGNGKPEITFYNGFRPRNGIRTAPRCEGVEPWATYENPAAEVLGIENLAAHGVQGRATMIDLFKHFGRENHAVTYDDLQSILEQDKVVIEKGDMVCLYTGLDDVILRMNKNPDPAILHHSCSGLDGSDKRLLSWITDSGIAALISDNFAVELMPKGPSPQMSHAMLPLHEHCLFKNGIHLGELWFLRDLAAWLREHGRSRFLLTAPPLHLPGAVGSPVTPVATV
ncbi:Putative cyclase [Enhydrobacter aerosaccus]|uniref:Putative cyclase n=1 Tax=Enhydrobacter aerosaccus TaxID=225324 RepID=A0A1T4TNA8_9HYPH|nr:cyclase family protein [Enhydrobacter aerosaccus]SKA41798.1 Putative cyclase [Enhydrobacter aerosaccus]